MRHVIMSPKWNFGGFFYPEYSVNLVNPVLNQPKKACIRVKGGIKPEPQEYTVFEKGNVRYKGMDKKEANRVFRLYCKANPENGFTKTYDVVQLECTHPTLATDKFAVESQPNGDPVIVKGEDHTDRCLLFVGCIGPYQCDVEIVRNQTTSRIIREWKAGSAFGENIEAIVILEKGQQIVFRTQGKELNIVYQYLWDGVEVKKTTFTWEDWKIRVEKKREMDMNLH